jgi:hypothetical protein
VSVTVPLSFGCASATADAKRQPTIANRKPTLQRYQMSGWSADASKRWCSLLRSRATDIGVNGTWLGAATKLAAEVRTTARQRKSSFDENRTHREERRNFNGKREDPTMKHARVSLTDAATSVSLSTSGSRGADVRLKVRSRHRRLTFGPRRRTMVGAYFYGSLLCDYCSVCLIPRAIVDAACGRQPLGAIHSAAV